MRKNILEQANNYLKAKKIQPITNECTRNTKEAFVFIRSLLSTLDSELNYPNDFTMVKNKNRIIHSLNVFILGLALHSYKNINREITTNYSLKNGFLKTWAVTSLLHDYALIFDDVGLAQNDIVRIELLKKHDFQLVLPLRYDEKHLVDYFYESKKMSYNHNANDHGMLASIFLTNKLLQRIKELGLCKHLFAFYPLSIADCDEKYNSIMVGEIVSFYLNCLFRIAEHNIWGLDFEDKQTFEKRFSWYNLYKGSKEVFPKITIRESLLYLLCICDTIEPYKKDQSFDISSAFYEESNNILYFYSKSFLSPFHFKEDWLDVEYWLYKE